MRKYLALSAAALATAALFTPSALAAAAAPKATGGIELSSPMQYVAFNATDKGAPEADRGTVKYANFDYASPGSGVWNVLGTFPLVFSFGGDYTHSLTVASIKPLSTTSTGFSGTGSYVAGPETTWTINGVVSGSTITFDLVYITGPYVPYSLQATGTINGDGSMSGTSQDTLGRTLPWTVPAGSVHEVLSYSAAVTCATVNTTDAAVSFVIPAGLGGLSGIPVLFTMTDGGSPGTGNDVWGQTTSFVGCDPATSVDHYEIVGGNLVVH
jgi:hypothetical protein